MTSDHLRDCRQGFFGAFHHVAAAGTVDVYVHKSGYGGLPESGDLLPSCRQTHVLPRADRLDHSIANQDPGVRDFATWGERTRGMQQDRCHRQIPIVTEMSHKRKREGSLEPSRGVLSQ